jgi:predicted transcriptional regulator
MSKLDDAKGKVNTALSRLERMVEDRLRVETERSDELAAKLNRLEREHEELKRVAASVEERLERAMDQIRTLLSDTPR